MSLPPTLSSFRYVEYASREVPDCVFNKEKLWCPGCPGFKNYGICSHVIAVNHILQACDVVDAVKLLSKPRNPGGFRSGVRPALLREDVADSSDDDGQAGSDSSEDEPLANRLKLRK